MTTAVIFLNMTARIYLTFALCAMTKSVRRQTIAYIGDSHVMLPLILSGVKGIDRIVPMGKTMDFDLIWDGYNLPALLTRTVVMA